LKKMYSLNPWTSDESLIEFEFLIILLKRYHQLDVYAKTIYVAIFH